MNAKKQPELIDAIAKLKRRKKVHHEARAIRAALPQWQDRPAYDGWYWCESLAADAPPQQIRLRGVIVERWTTSGWVLEVGRVAPCTGRPGE